MVAEKPIEEEGTSTDWTMVAEKDKGKRVMNYSLKSSSMEYQNTFTPLRIGEGPVGDDRRLRC